MVLLGLFYALVSEAENPAKADFMKDERTVLAVEGVEVRGGVHWHSAGVNNLRSGSRSYRHLAE